MIMTRGQKFLENVELFSYLYVKHYRKRFSYFRLLFLLFVIWLFTSQLSKRERHIEGKNLSGEREAKPEPR